MKTLDGIFWSYTDKGICLTHSKWGKAYVWNNEIYVAHQLLQERKQVFPYVRFVNRKLRQKQFTLPLYIRLINRTQQIIYPQSLN